MPKGQAKIGWLTAAAIVVANMVGTGAFTTLGFQLSNYSGTWAIMLLWIIGGVVAITGAFTYAEVATRLPRSGGEYHFLSKIYHPFLGYLSGWVSITVGFAASIALAAMAIGSYIENFLPFSGRFIASFSILTVALIHSFDLKQSSRFQNILTVFKVILVIVLIVAGFTLMPSEPNALQWRGIRIWDTITRPSYVVSLVYVIYAFSGWNA